MQKKVKVLLCWINLLIKAFFIRKFHIIANNYYNITYKT